MWQEVQSEVRLTPSALCPLDPIEKVAKPPVFVLVWQVSQVVVPVGTWLETSFIAPPEPVPWQV